MHPALSVILFTTVAGAGYGLLGLLCGLGATGWLPPAWWLGVIAFTLGFAAVVFGLVASTFHLGHPGRAWRAFFYWRSSWLSREGVLALLTLVPAALFALAWLRQDNLTLVPARWYGLGAALLAILTVFATAMIYASLKPVRAWRSIWVVPSYLLLAAMTGGLWLAVLVHGFDLAQLWQSEVLLMAIVASFIVKSLHWLRVTRGRSRTTPESATGLGILGKVHSFEHPHTEENYLMREMGFRIARKHAGKLRRIAIAAAFLAPAILTVLAAVLPRWPATVCALLAALAAMAGVLVERWLFFAEAKHVVTLYYGAKSA